jgi:HK97 family phage major capsid protein
MTKSQEKRELRAKLFKDMRGILDKADAEKRSMNADEQEKYNKMEADVDALKAEIDAIEADEGRRSKLAAGEAEMRRANNPQGIGRDGGAEGDGGEERGANSKRYGAAFLRYLRGGMENLNGEQRELLMAEFRDLGVSTGGAGGYTVPQGFYGQIVEAMKQFGAMLDPALVTMLPTGTGNDLPIPTSNDTAQTGEQLDENTAAADQANTFGQKTLKAWMFSSKTVYCSLQLLQDSAFPIESYLAGLLGRRLGRIMNSKFTTGAGTTTPEGVVVGSTLGKTGAAGQVATIIYDDIVDLVYSVDPAYRAASSFMCADTTIKVLRKLKDSQGRPLWEPSLTAGDPDVLFGYPVKSNNDMATPAASAKSLIFGDFKNYFVRLVGQVQMVRIEKNIDKLQVGFLGYQRADGQLINAGTNPIKHYIHPAA